MRKKVLITLEGSADPKFRMIKEMPIIPRIGDTIPVFYQPFPKVKEVILLPELLDANMRGLLIDAVVVVK